MKNQMTWIRLVFMPVSFIISIRCQPKVGLAKLDNLNEIACKMWLARYISIDFMHFIQSIG